MSEILAIERYMRVLSEPVARKEIQGFWADLKPEQVEIHKALCDRYRALGESPQAFYEQIKREQKAILEWEQEHESVL